ncbi:type VI secretion system-associated FHA domain protein TagH [Paraburkholderia sp. CNPSo 3157]|uniref:Type VI secretion system-associated FHA domain protein TagH n=1 Tax=Paraburkholderia franconis TaxID=2654983 RepID=A0A7X1TJC0_9BURK|nr:type VI secretion system-associated FHA domain protein TagH [Paraburkholderia franconis]MPW21311.1 type VI secretion system-associated FHA domain protein TagH [Paraburkholderia franconis]
MQLTVIEHAGRPVQHGVTAIFHPPGGTIGRNVDNHLVLPDETRQISRLQALLQIDRARCVLKNLSSVSVIEVNSTPLACAEERAIEPGDAIRIGSYMLRAVDDRASSSDAPQDSQATPDHPVQDDFWQSLESRYGNGGNGIAAGHQSGVRERQAPSQPHASNFYDDLRQVPADPLALFGPLADSPHDAMLRGSQSNLPESAAPLSPAASGTSGRRFDAPYAASDHAGGWAQSMRARPVATAAASPIQAADEAPLKGTGTHKMAATKRTDVSAEALLAAFLQGAGLDTASDQWTAEQLHTAGQLLALFANGTVKLLSSRSILKREVKADMTVLLDRENNPLKLLPDGSAVLRQMFGLPFPGFMSPKGAVSDAFDDLHAHQIAMVAGMRAALTELLKRFAPERLEQRTPVERLLDRFIPAWRKAQLWNAYSKLHHDTLLAVEDDFSAVFGSAFLAAYDAEVAQYRKSGRG